MLTKPVRRRIRDALGKADTFDPSQVEELPLGVYVAFGLSTEAATTLAITDAPDGIDVEDVDELHVMLAYMGDATAWPSDAVEGLAAILRRYACMAQPVSGATTGGGIVVGADPGTMQDACVALLDVDGLGDFRGDLTEMLTEFGMPPIAVNGLDHVTLAYGAAEVLQALPLPPVVPVTFDTLVLVVAGEATRIPLDGGKLSALMDAQYGYNEVKPIMRADDEQRYTMTPLYVPGVADSHGEGTDAATLQKAVWSYVDAGNRDVRLQHVPGTIAGRTVEIMSWPYPVTCSMAVPGQDAQDVTLPAHTVYQGVVWEPWAWALVKSGKLTGLSLGGTAYRVPTEGT